MAILAKTTHGAAKRPVLAYVANYLYSKRKCVKYVTPRSRQLLPQEARQMGRMQLEQSVARYLSQLDTADRQEPSEALAAKATRLKREACEAGRGNGEA